MLLLHEELQLPKKNNRNWTSLEVDA